MSFDDYRLNAQVRALLVRRWVDLSQVDYGVTNGVVYLRGSLQRIMSRTELQTVDPKQEEITLASRLDRALHRLPGVRDVVFRLDRLVRVGRRWRTR